MEEKDLVSVIVPIYNLSKYLIPCIESIINQSYTNIEIILVDDCSTDDSYFIMKAYAELDSRIKLLQNDKNSGISVARNNGMAIAKGKYIAFVDGDDWVHVSYIKTMLLVLLEKNVDLCVTSVLLYHDRKETVLTQQSIYYDNILLANLYNEKINPDIMINNIGLVSDMAYAKLYRADIIKEHQIVFPTGLCYEDIVFNLQYLYYSKYAVVIPDRLYFYRINRQGSIQYSSRKAFDILKVFQIIEAFLLQKGVYNKFKQPFIKFKVSTIAKFTGKKDNLYFSFYKKCANLLQNIDDSQLPRSMILLKKHTTLFFIKKTIVISLRPWTLFKVIRYKKNIGSELNVFHILR
jgi:glycosyltransferase involved in cell wall biosynthesis